MTIKKKTWLLTAFLIFIVLVLSGIQFQALRQVDSVMHSYRSQAVYRIGLLETIKSQFGYGGFIHNFKNHVLRGQAKYVDKFQKNDAEMKQALQELEHRATSPKDRKAIAAVRKVALQYADAIKISERMWAEGSTPTAIDKVVKISDKPAFEAFAVIEEETRGLEASSSAEMKRTLTRLYTLILCIFVVMVSCFVGYISLMFGTIRKIESLRLFTKEIGKGNFTVSSSINAHDEIGSIAKAFDEMVSQLRIMLKGVQNDTVDLDTSSASLSDTSSEMLSSAEDVMTRSSSVATAAEKMSANMNSVAAAAEQAATNVSMVATAAEEMLASFQEVSRNTNEATSITESAVEESKSASVRVHELGEAAIAIGNVTETINEISNQTNLLALNATIEAARAGEAGKGFAVVAGEIKNLANETSTATEEIKQSVGGIQASTQATVEQIEQISTIIDQVNVLVSNISASVDQQSGTTTEITRNVLEAAEGLDEVTRNVSQSSLVAGEVARDISDVHHAAEQLNGNSGSVDKNAAELRTLSSKLKSMVSHFSV